MSGNFFGLLKKSLQNINYFITSKKTNMQISKIISVMFIGLFLFSCTQTNKENLSVEKVSPAAMGETQISELPPADLKSEMSSDTTHYGGVSEKRKFIRTAELKFQVKDVIESTNAIEQITSRNGGFVNHTDLKSTIDNVTNKAVSEDSSLETTYYTVLNSIILRVPDSKLDSTLKEISSQIKFLDHRIIRSDDVSLQLLANELTQIRSTKNSDRLIRASDERGKKLRETIDVEDILASNHTDFDNARLNILSLKDRIKFSTVSISIYQRQALKRELISNDKNIDEYQPGFGNQIAESFNFGWEIIKSLILAITKIWGILVLLILVYIAHRTINSKVRKSRI